MKKPFAQFSILGKDPVYNRPEFGVEDPSEADQQVPISKGGSIEDIERLKPLIDALLHVKEAETRDFIARGLTALFIVWTAAGLLFYIITGNPWILVTGAGPGALFGSVVYYYFQRKKRKVLRNK